MMTHDEMIAVIQHHKDGGEVEFCSDKFWYKVDGIPSWDFRTYMYRPYIKPKPKQVVAIEKWLIYDNLSKSYSIAEESNIEGFLKDDRAYLSKVKLLDTYEVEL